MYRIYVFFLRIIILFAAFARKLPAARPTPFVIAEFSIIIIIKKNYAISQLNGIEHELITSLKRVDRGRCYFAYVISKIRDLHDTSSIPVPAFTRYLGDFLKSTSCRIRWLVAV